MESQALNAQSFSYLLLYIQVFEDPLCVCCICECTSVQMHVHVFGCWMIRMPEAYTRHTPQSVAVLLTEAESLDVPGAD